jgi:hypothetical protein
MHKAVNAVFHTNLSVGPTFLQYESVLQRYLLWNKFFTKMNVSVDNACIEEAASSVMM